jgi:hypothetical protein
MGWLKHLLVTVVLISGLPTIVPTAAPAQEAATEIVVTNNSDVSNGDTSSAANLAANPGDDGISLREAIAATNNDPGSYIITFDTALIGTTILLSDDLPALLGGGLTIDGDIDDDPQPDVTLRSDGAQAGFKISSSNNRLRSIKLARFQFGVILQPPVNSITTGATFADNAISGMVMRGIGKAGINLDPTALGNCGVPCNSANTWSNTTVSANVITAKAAGIFFWNSSSGERVEHVKVTDNEITITGRAVGPGISFETAGPLGGEASTGARISDVLIARNSVSGSPDMGIGVAAGTGRGQDGAVTGARVIDNRVELVKTGSYYCCQGIVVLAGSDDPSFAAGPPVRYLDDNTVRDVVVRNNVVSGTLEWGIALQAAWGGGGRRNRVRDVRIKQNVVRTSAPGLGVMVVNGGGTPYDNRYTSDNRIAGVVIASNRFVIGTGSDFRTAGPGIMAAGIALIGGGTWSRENVVRDVRMARNTIKSSYFGIEIIGGLDDTARRNRVICVPLRDNRIRGARKDVSIRANVRGATGNKVRLDAC